MSDLLERASEEAKKFGYLKGDPNYEPFVQGFMSAYFIRATEFIDKIEKGDVSIFLKRQAD